MQHLCGDFTLYCYRSYISRYFLKKLLSLFTLPVYYLFYLSPSLPLLSYFYSFLISPSFLFSRSFPISLFPFFSPISSILTSFSLFFFSTSLPLYTSSIYPLSYPSFLFSPLINTAPIRRFYTLLLSLLYLLFFSKNFFRSLLFSSTIFSIFILLYLSLVLFLLVPDFSLFSLLSLLRYFSIPFLFSYLFLIYFFLPFLFSSSPTSLYFLYSIYLIYPIFPAN